MCGNKSNGNPNRGLLVHFWASDARDEDTRVQHFSDDVQAILHEWNLEANDTITIWDGKNPQGDAAAGRNSIIARERMAVFANLFPDFNPDQIETRHADNGIATLNLENGNVSF